MEVWDVFFYVYSLFIGQIRDGRLGLAGRGWGEFIMMYIFFCILLIITQVLSVITFSGMSFIELYIIENECLFKKFSFKHSPVLNDATSSYITPV